jgi:tetrahydromethanopterin S-methyltransferase subunit C
MSLLIAVLAVIAAVLTGAAAERLIGGPGLRTGRRRVGPPPGGLHDFMIP